MHDKINSVKTIRLLMPQWQGGNMGQTYPLGARLLAWLAPESDAPLVEVPVESYTGQKLESDDGIVGRDVIVRQLRSAWEILEEHRPDCVVTFGGDCLVSQAPFDYLNGRYGGKLGILWLDAHPDVMTPNEYAHAHAMVLGNLIGEGDPGLSKEVRNPVDPRLVMYAGVDELSAQETEVLGRRGMSRAGSGELTESSAPVLRWIADNGIRHLAVHFDLDVLDPKHFRSLLFNNPDAEVQFDSPNSKLTLSQVARLIRNVSQATDVVGLTFAEHMPWDDINLKEMMEQLPIMK